LVEELRASLAGRSAERDDLQERRDTLERALERVEAARKEIRTALRAGRLSADEAGDDPQATQQERERLRREIADPAHAAEHAEALERQLTGVAADASSLANQFAQHVLAAAQDGKQAVREAQHAYMRLVITTLIDHIAVGGSKDKPQITITFEATARLVAQPSPAESSRPHSNMSK
jgi:chromosome segregation ATPase